MKIKLLIAAALSSLILVGCGYVSAEIVDCRIIPAHDEARIIYEYRYSGKHFTLIPNVSQVHVPEQYQIKNKYTYENGRVYYGWQYCTKDEYDKAKNEKCSSENGMF